MAGTVVGGRVEPPRQARSRRSYHRMLEAAVELLADRGLDDITVDEIAGRAGYTKGAFYARFEGKGALLGHLVGRLTEGAESSWDAFLDPGRWAGVPAAEVVEAFVRRMVSIYARSGDVLGVIERELGRGGDEAVRARVTALDARVASGLVGLLAGRREVLPGAVRADLEGECRYWLTALRAVLGSGYAGDGVGVGVEGAMADRVVRLMVPYLTAEV
jgi:AcrR family transcriptional regulator